MACPVQLYSYLFFHQISIGPGSPEFRVFPYENASLEPFETAVAALNPVVAVKVRSAAVHAALAEVYVLLSWFCLAPRTLHGWRCSASVTVPIWGYLSFFRQSSSRVDRQDLGLSPHVLDLSHFFAIPDITGGTPVSILVLFFLIPTFISRIYLISCLFSLMLTYLLPFFFPSPNWPCYLLLHQI